MASASTSPFTSLMASPTDGEIPQFVNLDSKYLCPICKNVMQGPVQTECGHRTCLSCINTYMQENTNGSKPLLCPINEDGCEEVTKETIYPDYNMKKRIESQLVFCKNKDSGCTEQIKWKDLSQHLDVCKFKSKDCPNREFGCRDTVSEVDFQQHVTSKCLFRPEECRLCKSKIVFSRMDEHQRDECTEAFVKCPNVCSASVMKRKDLRQHLSQCAFGDPTCPYVGCTFIGRNAAALLDHEKSNAPDHIRLANIKIRQQDEANEAAKKLIESLKTKERNMEKSHARLELKMIQLEEVVRKLQDSSETNDSLRTISDEVNSNANRLRTLESGYSGSSASLSIGGGRASGFTSIPEDVRSLVLNHDSYIKEHDQFLKQLDIRIQCQEGVSFDGTLVWKISDFTKRKLDARNGEAMSIYSQPFYTHRFGYKMCIRGYLNGDGIGKNSHLSLFFVLMKGEFDALLKWPFMGKVTFMLVDQEKGQRHIQDVFRTDPTSSSFKRPQTEMNIATGCPRFASHDVLEQKPFMLNDTIYIRVVVESVHTATR